MSDHEHKPQPYEELLNTGAEVINGWLNIGGLVFFLIAFLFAWGFVTDIVGNFIVAFFVTLFLVGFGLWAYFMWKQQRSHG